MTAEKVMLVEDDPTMLALLDTLLKIEGYGVIHVERTDLIDLLLETVRNERPALILLDVHLHNASGFDFLQRLRQEDDLKSARILMSSGMDLGSRCLQEGADGFILKPYMPEDLIREIRYLLRE